MKNIRLYPQYFSLSIITIGLLCFCLLPTNVWAIGKMQKSKMRVHLQNFTDESLNYETRRNARTQIKAQVGDKWVRSKVIAIVNNKTYKLRKRKEAVYLLGGFQTPNYPFLFKITKDSREIDKVRENFLRDIIYRAKKPVDKALTGLYLYIIDEYADNPNLSINKKLFSIINNSNKFSDSTHGIETKAIRILQDKSKTFLHPWAVRELSKSAYINRNRLLSIFLDNTYSAATRVEASERLINWASKTESIDIAKPYVKQMINVLRVNDPNYTELRKGIIQPSSRLIFNESYSIEFRLELLSGYLVIMADENEPEEIRIKAIESTTPWFAMGAAEIQHTENKTLFKLLTLKTTTPKIKEIVLDAIQVNYDDLDHWKKLQDLLIDVIKSQPSNTLMEKLIGKLNGRPKKLDPESDKLLEKLFNNLISNEKLTYDARVEAVRTMMQFYSTEQSNTVLPVTPKAIHAIFALARQKFKNSDQLPDYFNDIAQFKHEDLLIINLTLSTYLEIFQTKRTENQEDPSDEENITGLNKWLIEINVTNSLGPIRAKITNTSDYEWIEKQLEGSDLAKDQLAAFAEIFKIDPSKIDAYKEFDALILLLESKLDSQPSWFEQLPESVKLAIKVILPAYIFLGLALLLLYWRAPLLLIWLDTLLNRLGKIKLPFGDIELSARVLCLTIFFAYRKRILDAWVNQHISTARNNFNLLPAVQSRFIHIDLPVIMSDSNHPATLNKNLLQPLFASKRKLIMVWGEGGSGKTSIVCEMAKMLLSDNHKICPCNHRIIPIWIDYSLINSSNQGQLFSEIINWKLKELIEADEIINEDLLRALLKYKRIMVIIDSLSEMNQSSRDLVFSPDIKVPVNLMLSTSRIQEDFSGRPITEIKPTRFKGATLTHFVEAYLKALRQYQSDHPQKINYDLSGFTDIKIFKTCAEITEMAGKREITVLMAKLYIDYIIASNDPTKVMALQSIPDLMLAYVSLVNRQANEEQIDDPKIIKALQTIAWICLKEDFVPTVAKLAEVEEALVDFDANLLKYLEKQLQLVEVLRPDLNKIRFTLDPLNEYLAALYCINSFGKDSSKWSTLFENIRQKDQTKIQGFLAALNDCITTKIGDKELLKSLEKELSSILPKAV